MTDSSVQDQASGEATVVAAIDVGTNSIRMAIAQVLEDGHVEVLEQLRRAARLGQHTFRRGRLDEEGLRAAVTILRDYRRHVEPYQPSHVRVVATSAIREARNADMFLERVFMATGYDVEVIDTAEEGRLTVSAVRDGAVKLGRGRTLIGEVGGGSTVLTVINRGHIVTTQALPLGAIRLQEILATSSERPDRSADLLRQHVASELTSTASDLALPKIRAFVAVGGDVRFAAQQIGHPEAGTDVHVIDGKDLDAFLAEICGETPEGLVTRYGLGYAEAETLVPALLVTQALLAETAADQMTVSTATMRDGLLLDLAMRVTGREDSAFASGLLHAAEGLAEKYAVDMAHARAVRDLSLWLFDELEDEHGLDRRHRLLLNVAALLHEVGRFVNTRAHHKHGYYLIANTELFGLSREERMIVAHVARYHRRSVPKTTHLDYMALPRRTRMAVCKLAAILRVADCLDRGHAQQVHDVRCEQGDGELVLHVGGAVDLTLERRAIKAKGDLFADIYGLTVRLEADPTTDGPARRAEAIR